MVDVTRRSFVVRTATGVGAVALGPMAAGRLLAEQLPETRVRGAYFSDVTERLKARGAKPNELGVYSMTVTARYLTDPERIARMLPPHLEPDEEPEVMLDWFVFLSSPDRFVAFIPGWTYSEADLFVAAKYKGNSVMLPVALVLEQDFGRYAGREGVTLRKMDGLVNIDLAGNRVRAWSTRQGKLLTAIESEITDEPAHPRYWMREVGWGWMRCDYRLHPDWRKGPIEGDVNVWRHFGYDAGYPTDFPAAEHLPRCPRAGDLAKTRIEVGLSEGLDAFGEFPVREILGVAFVPPGGGRIPCPRGPDGKLYPYSQEGQDGTRYVTETRTAEEYAPWAFLEKGYDPPISRNKVWVPEGWPERASAFKLSPDMIARYRSREALELDPAELVDIRLELDPALLARTLPPPCAAASGTPNLRIIAVRAEASDHATVPFPEIWLLARCVLDGSDRWYALSHIVGWDGDVTHTRETFGYPSKHGIVELTVDPMQVSLLVRRFERDVMYATLPLSLDEAERVESNFEVIGIQPAPRDVTPKARYITQPWSVVIDRARTAYPEDVRLSFPEEPGPALIGVNDPWFEFKAAKVVSVKVGPGRVRRFPGTIRMPFDPDANRAFIYDRMDGFTGRAPQKSSFLAGK